MLQKFFFRSCLLAVSLFFVNVATVSATTVTAIRGTVYYPDGTTGVPDVQVSIQGNIGLSRITDSNGNFSFSGDSSEFTNGDYQLTATAPAGYIIPAELPVTLTYSGSTVTQNITLISAPKQITVTVRDTEGNLITDASVNAAIVNNDIVHATSYNNNDGTTDLYMTGGTWLVNVDVGISSYGANAPAWVPLGESQQYVFAEDSTAETAAMEFTVLRSNHYIEKPFLDTDGTAYTDGDRVDVVYTCWTDDYGLIMTKRKIDLSGVGSLYLYPGICHFAVSGDTLPDDKSLPPDETSFVVTDTTETQTFDPIQFVANSGSISGTAYLVSYDGSGNATEAVAGNTDVVIMNLDTGVQNVHTTNADGVYMFGSLGLGNYSLTISGNSIIPLQSESAKITVDQTSITGVDVKGTAVDTTIVGNVELSNVAVENVPAVVVLEGNGQRFTAQVESDGSYSLQAYAAAFGEETPNLFLATQPGAEVYTTEPVEVGEVGELVNITADVQVQNNEATISGQLENQSGEALTSAQLGDNSQVLAMDLTTGSTEQATLASDGQFSMAVAPGDWIIVPRLEKGIDDIIVPTSSSEPITVVAGETTSDVTLPAVEATVTVSGQINDPSGNAVAEAPVVLTNLPALQEQVIAEGLTVDPADVVTITTSTDGDGNYSALVPENQTFTAYFGSNPTVESYTEPATQEIIVGTTDVTADTASFREADATLSGTVSDVREASVTIYSPDNGGSQSVDVNEDGSYSIPVTPGDWQVAVSGVKDGELYMTQTDVTITAGSNTLNPTLEATGVEIPATITTSGGVEETLTVTNAVGASATLQPYAAGFEGDVQLTIAPDPTVVFTNGIAQASLSYDITAVDDSGFTISQLNSPATITLPIDEALIENENLELVPSYLEPSMETFMFDVVGETDADNMLLSTTHLTRFSMVTVGDVTIEQPNRPRATTVKKRKQTQVTLDWKAPRQSVVTKYKVQLRKFGVKKQSKWTEWKNVQQTEKVAKQLKRAMRYQFRVKACNAVGCSKNTKWESFKTKP